MEYKELKELLDNLSMWEKHIVDIDDEPEDNYFNMSLQEFLDSIFWAGDADWDYDDQKWTSVPQRNNYNEVTLAGLTHKTVVFTDGTGYYSMKLVAADNDTVKVGEPLWWETPTVRPKYYKPDWNYATMVEITKQGDPDILRIWQTYGEPHGSWEWELQKLGTPATINYLRLK